MIAFPCFYYIIFRQQFYIINGSNRPMNSEFIRDFVKDVIKIRKQYQIWIQIFSIICDNSYIYPSIIINKL